MSSDSIQSTRSSQLGLDGVGDLVGERARRDERRLLLQRGRLGKAERVDRVAQQRHLELQRVTIVVAELAADPAQHPEHLPRPDEVGGAHVVGAVGERGPQIGDRAEGAGDRERLSQLGVVLDGREQVEQVVLELGQVLEHVPGTGVEEVDDPDVVVGVDQDVGRVEIAVHVRHVVVVLRWQRVVGQEVLVEAADVGQRHPAGELEHLRPRLRGDGGDTGPHRRCPFGGELVVLEKRHPLVAGRRVQRAEDLVEGGLHGGDDARVGTSAANIDCSVRTSPWPMAA